MHEKPIDSGDVQTTEWYETHDWETGDMRELDAQEAGAVALAAAVVYSAIGIVVFWLIG